MIDDGRGHATRDTPGFEVRLRGITKSFGGVRALRGADLDLISGQTTGLVGENGAGKSTLVKTLAGIHQPDDGSFELNGLPVSFRNPAESQHAGIAVIHQEPTLFPDLTVSENIFMGRQPRRAGIVAWGEMNSLARDILSTLDSRLSPSALVSSLSIAEQQIVDIAKALSQNARLLVMDEPTAALSGAEVTDLLRLVTQLNHAGVSVLYISHRLDEVLEVSHSLTVLRDGQTVASGEAAAYDEASLIAAMVGRELSEIYPAVSEPTGGDAIVVDSLSRIGEYKNVSFSVRAGEVLGFAGLIGAGRTEVARSLFGLSRPTSGQVWIDGRPAKLRTPKQAMKAGIAYVPEDRRQHGLVLPFGIGANVSMASLGAFSRLGFISPRLERESALEYIRSLSIRASGPDQPAGTLSGGNQQKVVLAKWLRTKPKILILDEPTRGVDVGAKSEVYRIIAQLASQGLAVILISSELPEVLAMSNRVLVFREGRVTGELSRSEANQESVMTLATRSNPVGGEDR